MKTLKPLALASLVVFSAASALAAPRIGVLLRDQDIFYGSVKVGAAEAGAAAGAEMLIKAPQMANSLSQQLAMLAALDKEPLDALIASPLTADEFKEPLAKFAARGVKIVLIETVMPEGTANTYLGYNQKEMAETAARLFARLVQDGDEVAMMRANSLERVSLREKTLLATIHELLPKSTVHADIMAGATKGDDYEKSLLLLERHPAIKAVCTPFSASSIGMIKALQEKKLTGKVLHVGFGTGLPPAAAEALESGAMQGWIAQQPKLFGSRGVEAAIDLINGKTVPATIDVQYFVVTKANLQEPAIVALRN